MVEFKKCPRCNSDLVEPKSRFCASCGLDLKDAALKLPAVVNQSGVPLRAPSTDLTRPLKGCWYLLIGLTLGTLLQAAPWYLLYGAALSKMFTQEGLGVVMLVGGIVLLAMFPLVWFFGTEGMYGRFSFNGVCNLLILSVLPVGGWVATYYFGKGVYMAITRQRLLAVKRASPAGWICGAVILAIALILTFTNRTGNQQAAMPPENLQPAGNDVLQTQMAVTAIAATNVQQAWLTFTAPTRLPPCFRWSDITIAMKGRTVCFRGMVEHLIQTTKTKTRYTFSSAPNTFFLFTNKVDIYDSRTGKTLGPGTCLEVTAPIEVQSDVPYMNLDPLASGRSFRNFQLYDDPSVCQ